YLYEGSEVELELRIKNDSTVSKKNLFYYSLGKKLYSKSYKDDVTVTSEKIFHQDILGNNILLTDTTGEWLEKTTYGPFGDVISEKRRSPSSSIQHPTSYKFTGKERDSESDLDYFGARYLDYNNGRWMKPDIITGDIANPQSLNRVIYCINSPLKFVDLFGLWQIDVDQQTGIAYGVVEEGDTLWDLAHQLTGEGGRWKDLAISEEDAKELSIGQRIDISALLHPIIVSSLEEQAKAEQAGDYSPHRDKHHRFKGNPKDISNCWATATEIIGESVSNWTPGTFMTQDQANRILDKLEKGFASSSLVRYGSENPKSNKLDKQKLTHFSIYLLKSKSGSIFVFSQEGWGGKYKINTNLGMPSLYGGKITYYKVR
ncbi:RHS repeat-associated core domain-containing protein, partial [bacterium]|nr:RHS repeat-associated core domain-containing protein [bacterium]